MQMKEVVTFILPTRNRKQFVRRAVDSCLLCENEIVSPFVIVIDGESEDRTFTDLQTAYGDDVRVHLIQNSKTTGFMNTCFQGVSLVRSKWVTFMYDDDVLSPYFVDMVTELISSSDGFIMGYGAGFSADDVYPFKPIAAYKRYKPEQLILAYCGPSDDIDYKGLPVSPIACVTTLDVLHQWVPAVKQFCAGNALRNHFMLRRNIGPNLMIYLLSLLKYEGYVPVALAVVGQFSEHTTSMSIQYGTDDLAVGYWLAKIWAFENLVASRHRIEAAKCGSALALVGIRILAGRVRRFDMKWAAIVVTEIFGVITCLLRNNMLIQAMKEGSTQFVEWRRSRTRQAIP
jgi:hypothetical protein